MANTYVSGTLIRLSNWTGTVAVPIDGYRDASGNLADPTTVTLKYRPGNAAATVTVIYPSSPLIKDNVGLYHADIDSSGQVVDLDEWEYEFIGTGAIIAAKTNILEVLKGL